MQTFVPKQNGSVSQNDSGHQVDNYKDKPRQQRESNISDIQSSLDKIVRRPVHDIGHISVFPTVSQVRREDKAVNEDSVRGFARPYFKRSMLGVPESKLAAEKQADEIARRVAVPGPVTHDRLPLALAERLEKEIGGDFGRVRVHADAHAAKHVDQYGAKAMSEGRDIYFANGQWRPDTTEGALLAAHEAVHAAQQQFAEPGMIRGAGRYFKKDPPPKADSRDIFEEIKKRAPDVGVFITNQTIVDAINGKVAEGPAVPGGTDGTDTHEWHITITRSYTSAGGQTASKPIVTTKKVGKKQIIKHVIPILWGTFNPLGSGKENEALATAAEQNKTLPTHAPRAKDFALELALIEPLIHELLHARIIMETDPTYTAAGHTALVQGYLDMIAVSQSPAVKKDRDFVRGKIAVLAGLRDTKPSSTEMMQIVDKYDQFLVHEKYDGQKVFALMGRANPTNQKVAKAYADVIDGRLAGEFGDVSVSDAMAQKLQLEFIAAIVAYYDAIDKAATAPAGSNPTPAQPTGSQPSPSAPAKDAH